MAIPEGRALLSFCPAASAMHDSFWQTEEQVNPSIAFDFAKTCLKQHALFVGAMQAVCTAPEMLKEEYVFPKTFSGECDSNAGMGRHACRQFRV